MEWAAKHSEETASYKKHKLWCIVKIMYDAYINLYYKRHFVRGRFVSVLFDYTVVYSLLHVQFEYKMHQQICLLMYTFANLTRRGFLLDYSCALEDENFVIYLKRVKDTGELFFRFCFSLKKGKIQFN